MENIVKPATAEVKKNNKRRNKKSTKPTQVVENKEIKVTEKELPSIVNHIDNDIKVSLTVTKITLLQKIKNWFKRK